MQPVQRFTIFSFIITAQLSIATSVALLTPAAFAGGVRNSVDFGACSPTSEFSDDKTGPLSAANLGFCAAWNPEFANNNFHCCGKAIAATGEIRNRKAKNTCDPHRRKYVYCDEMTDEQKRYIDQVQDGKIADVLALIDEDVSRKRSQAFCSVADGFLVSGRPILPSEKNRIELRDARRCTEFGTDNMAGLLEWTGRKVAEQYPGPEYKNLHLLLGDISAPRGGCLSGRGGRRGHKSHTTGQDVDVGYLTPKANQASPPHFHRNFDAKVNWWLLKQIFENPFACVKVVFLDKHHINSLAKIAWNDPKWPTYRKYIRHIKGHRDHMHVRIGDGPGAPGCAVNTDQEIEDQTDPDDSEAETDEAQAAFYQRTLITHQMLYPKRQSKEASVSGAGTSDTED